MKLELKTGIKALDAAMNPPNPAHVIAEKFESAASEPILPSADKKKIDVAEVNHKAAWTAVNITFTDQAAKKHFQKQLESQAAQPDANFADIRTRGWESVQSEFLAKQDVMRLRMVAIAKEVAPIIETAISRYIAAGEKWTAARTAAEKAEAAEYGLDFVPSQILIRARYELTKQKNRQANGVSLHCAPSENLDFLKISN